MTYKALNRMAPSYLCDLLQVHHPDHNRRSLSRGLLLEEPNHQSQACGARSFSVAASFFWNSLPVDIKNAQTLFSLKESSKHFYLIDFEFSFILYFYYCIDISFTSYIICKVC